MIETYAFLAAFAVQILVMSVLLPTWFIRNLRAKAARFSAERLEQVYPGVDVNLARERFLAQYRMLTASIGVLGLLLLGWLFAYARGADWNGSKAGLLVTGYFMVALVLPLFQFGRFAARFNKEHKAALGKRTAILQPRRLFDFVSPFIVFLAVLSYLLHAAVAIYIEQHPFPGFAGALVNIGAMTLLFAVNAFAVYIILYGKKSALETHAARRETIGLAVRGMVYASIVMFVNMSLNHLLKLLELKSWEPFLLSIFFAISAILVSMGFAAPLRKPEADGLNPSPTS